MKNFFLIILTILFSLNFILAAPTISNITVEPANPSYQDDVIICANITDSSENIAYALLHYYLGGQKFVLMFETEEDIFCANLSNSFINPYEGQIFSYYISARNNLYNETTTQEFSFVYTGTSSEESSEQNESTDSTFEIMNFCKYNETGNLNIDIDNLDSDDEFAPGDTIKISVEVENNNDDDKKIIVEAKLYNLDEEDKIESVKSSKNKIDEDDDEEFELELEIPIDVEEGDYVLFVKAYESGNEQEQCTQESIDLEITREDNSLEILSIDIKDYNVHSGGFLEIFFHILNLGEDGEENIYLYIENSELNISEKKGKFDIEGFGESDDEIEELFKIKIPFTATPGNYNFIFSVKGDESKDSISKTITIQNSTLKTFINNFAILNPGTITSENHNVKAIYSFKIINASFALSIFVVVILILIVRKKLNR
jgi:hypothetical protein